MRSLFRTKSHERILADAEAGEHTLHRTLSATHLTLLGIGCIIGAGIFVLSGQAAAIHAGPAVSLSFVLSALCCVFAGLCYAEFASMIPVAGSAYTYSYATLGELFAWIIGWDLILEYLFGAATVAVGWSGYVTSFMQSIGKGLPVDFTSPVLSYDPHSGAIGLSHHYGNFPAVAIILAVTALLIIGIRESANFNAAIVAVKLTVILLVIGFGFRYVDTANWRPFIPENNGHFGEFGWSGILSGAGMVFFSYIGFDAVSTAAQEAKNPQRDLPRGILWSLLVCTVLYVLVSLVMTGMVHYSKLNVDHPMALAVQSAGDGLKWLAPWISIGAIAGLSSVILVLMLGQTRVFFSMAKDRLLPDRFASVHPRFKTPAFATVVTGLCSAVMAFFCPIDLLGHMVSIGALLAFAMVCAGVMVMRRTMPDKHRPFRTPWVPFIPVMGIVLSVAQMAGLPFGTWMRLIVWMALGFAIYFLYSRKRATA